MSPSLRDTSGETRRPWQAAALAGLILLGGALGAQTALPGGTTLAQAQSAIAPTGAAADVTLSGVVAFIHGQNTETGTVTFTALADGTTQAAFSMANRAFTEQWAPSTEGGATRGAGGRIVTSTGTSVDMPYAAWWAPGMLTALAGSAGYASADLGPATVHGVQVEHLRVTQAIGAGEGIAGAALRKRTRFDLYLDPASHRPLSAVFQIWPYHKPGTSLSSPRPRPAAEEVRYSNYQEIAGHSVALHLDVYLGLTRIMAVDFGSVAFNTGVQIVPLG